MALPNADIHFLAIYDDDRLSQPGIIRQTDWIEVDRILGSLTGGWTPDLKQAAIAEAERLLGVKADETTREALERLASHPSLALSKPVSKMEQLALAAWNSLRRSKRLDEEHSSRRFDGELQRPAGYVAWRDVCVEVQLAAPPKVEKQESAPLDQKAEQTDSDGEQPSSQTSASQPRSLRSIS